MKKLLLSLILIPFFIISCNNRNENGSVIAKRIGNSDTPLIAMDFNKLNDTLTIPLSTFIKNYESIILEASDEAFVSPGRIVVSDNFVFVAGKGEDNKLSVKRYDRATGKFLNRVGSHGRGPFEYNLIYDIQVDEKNNSIYILPWQSYKILHFDLSGNPVKEIPLPYFSAKGVFRINPDNTITVAVLPFPNNPSFIWQQDMDGNVLSEIDAEPFKDEQMSYSNEMISHQNISGVNDIYLFNFMNKQDTLYHFDYSNNSLEPVFTVDYGAIENIPVHSYKELPNHFIGDVTIMEQTGPNQYSGTKQFNYIVDKSTLQGNYFKLEDDFYGGIITYPSFYLGYNTRMFEPELLMERLNKILENKDLAPDIQKRVQNLLNSLNPEGNSVVLLGKMK